MYAFLIGLAVAAILTVGAVLTFNWTGITMAERSSPAASVRLDANRSKTAGGSGYGVPRKSPDVEETARR